MMTTILDWLNAPAFTAFGAPTSNAEIIGFLSGAFCVYLVARANVWNWPVGIVNAVMFIVLFTTAGLFADAWLQVVFITLGVYGWWMWTHTDGQRAERPITTANVTTWLVMLGALVVATGTLYWVLTTYTSSTVPLFDAATTGLSLVAVAAQTLKKIEGWYFWIAADLIYIPLYQHKGLSLTAILYVGFLSLCIYGLIGWRRTLAAQDTDAAVARLVLTEKAVAAVTAEKVGA